jgi:GNAT superfamily N-acetyltransferase
MSTVVRRILPGDGYALAILRHEALRHEPHAFAMSVSQLALPHDASWTQLCHRNATGTDALFVATSDGAVIGMVGCRVDNSDKMAHCGMIWGMYVTAAYTGRGYGSQLIGAAIAHGAHWRLRMLKLSVTVNQLHAIALHQRHGFQVYAHEPALLCIDNQEIDALHMVYRYSDGGTL